MWGEKEAYLAPVENVPQDAEFLEAEGAQRARGAAAPERPCPEMVESHNLTHLPFARWCPVCVQSRAPDRSTFDKSRGRCGPSPWWRWTTSASADADLAAHSCRASWHTTQQRG